MSDDTYPDFEQYDFAHDGISRTVFKQGSGPAVIVMHEVPGLYPEVADFGRVVAKQGFTVYMPSLVGTPGRKFTLPYNLQTMAKICVRREFTTFATGRNSEITTWLRGLARAAHEECGGPGVGAVGMCLTGGFALAMMVDDTLLAPVLSQPSLPFAVTGKQKRDLGIDEATLARVKQRAAEDDVCVMGLRFTGDPLVPAQRFNRLADELGDRFIAVEIDSSRGNPHGVRRTAHSVLVYDYVDRPEHPTYEARQQVLAFFRDRLLPP